MRRRFHAARDAALAVTLLTLIPVRVDAPADERTEAAAWFPAVGTLFGLLGYGAVHAAEYSHVATRAPFVIAVLLLSAWALLSRLLHFDGLADVADGFWGSHEADRRLEIMSDSHTGAFGASAVALVALLEAAALGTLIAHPHELPMLVVPVIARFSATCAAWLGTPAKPDGLGRSVMGHPSTLGFVIGLVPVGGALLGLWLGFHLVGIVLGALGVVLALAVPHVLAVRFGGVTGDVMGASVLLTESILFALVALVV
jgi:adenosylcobinamide-GDP ribazoletransferase